MEMPEKILVADDDPICRRVLKVVPEEHHHEVISCPDGQEAWDRLQQPGAPSLAILDWMMPGMDGLEVCRRVRAAVTPLPAYLILLTVKDQRRDVILGLQSGADDYAPKPFDHEELLTRVQVGLRVVHLQRHLAQHVPELEMALGQVKQLQGILPMCPCCKKVRDDQNYWEQVEGYLARNFNARFSHGICPDCFATQSRMVSLAS